MEKKANYYIAGLFVTTAFAALIGFMIWLISPRDSDNSVFYTVYFTDSINGLQEGTEVTYRGMDAGKVQSIRLDPARVDLIKVDIAVDKAIPVRAHTRAELNVQGVTGIAQLELSTAPGDTEALATPEGEKYPVLKGSPSKLTKVVNGISKLVTEGNAAAESMHKLSDDLRANPSQIIFGAKKKPAPDERAAGRQKRD